MRRVAGLGDAWREYILATKEMQEASAEADPTIKRVIPLTRIIVVKTPLARNAPTHNINSFGLVNYRHLRSSKGMKYWSWDGAIHESQNLLVDGRTGFRRVDTGGAGQAE